jgi:hypothetical protein
MARVRRGGVGLLLLSFMLIDVAIWLYTSTAGAQLNSHIDLGAQQAGWTIIDAALVWRVWGGARWAWLLLILLDVVPLAELLIGGVRNFYVLVLYAFLINQILILLTPAVRHHVHPGEGLRP